jgi:UDP-2-acetamido-3-amino-2,3-dideoxy-glucuronate N-acetyltransferase
MGNKVNVAVVGGGYWGKNLIRNFDALGALKCICEKDVHSLEELSRTFGKAEKTDSFEKILADPSIDAVVIASPAEMHYAMAKASLLAGKDVFVEKPMALRSEEGEELHDLAVRKEKILMVGHLLQYHPAVIGLKQLISTGELGRIQYIYSNRLNLGKIRQEENILWSFAPHDISVILSLTGEMPDRVVTVGANYLHQKVADVTLSSLSFASGIKAHVFVSWLNPYKEQRLVVVGDRKMAVFNDVEPTDKLLLYPHRIEWKNHVPVPDRKEAEKIPLEKKEPLREECLHFLECVDRRVKPRTDGEEGIRVLKVLQACQQSMEKEGKAVDLKSDPAKTVPAAAFVHETAIVDPGCEVGQGTKIWHFSHVIKGSKVGRDCNVGQNVVIGPDVTVGNKVKIQNNVSVYDGVTLEDGVFCGPSMVFTNVYNPRSYVPRKNELRKTLVREGATLGANATIVCGNTIGRFAFVGAGSVVTRSVPDYAMVVGNPAQVKGWMCRCGVRLRFEDVHATCEVCKSRYLRQGDIVAEAK